MIPIGRENLVFKFSIRHVFQVNACWVAEHHAALFLVTKAEKRIYSFDQAWNPQHYGDVMSGVKELI